MGEERRVGGVSQQIEVDRYVEAAENYLDSGREIERRLAVGRERPDSVAEARHQRSKVARPKGVGGRVDAGPQYGRDRLVPVDQGPDHLDRPFDNAVGQPLPTGMHHGADRSGNEADGSTVGGHDNEGKVAS